MKIGWTSFDQYKNYRKRALLRSPGLPPALGLIVMLGLAVLIAQFVTGLQIKNEAAAQRRLLDPNGRRLTTNSYESSRVTPANQSKVVDIGVQALRQHTPGELIRGQLNSEYDIHDFEVAATKLALQDPKAAYIMGWLCENGDRPESNYTKKLTPSIYQIDLAALGFDQSKVLAGEWYTISSFGGLGAGSVQMARLLQKATEPNRAKCLMLANDFLQKGMAQGDATACVALGQSYAYGLGVEADGERAWDLFAKIIYSRNSDDADDAIIAAIQAWKDGKMQPPTKFSKNKPDAYSFVRNYDPEITKNALDNLYYCQGCLPDPTPQLRLAIADKIRLGLSPN
jgi:hypothetical protein